MTIYFYHIERCGGTSMNKMFLNTETPDYEKAYQHMIIANGNRVTLNGKTFVGWSWHVLVKANYYYGFSHIPSYEIVLPDSVFKFTIFRNPVDRVISYYKKLQDIKKSGIDNYYLKKGDKLVYRKMFEKDEIDLLGTFDEFLNNIPRYRLQKQLYMFSKSYDIGEALGNVKNLNHFMFMEDWDRGVTELNKKLNLNLKTIKDNVGLTTLEVTQKQRVRLEKMLGDELEFYRKVCNL